MLNTVPSAGQAISSSENWTSRLGLRKKKAQKHAITRNNAPNKRNPKSKKKTEINKAMEKKRSPMGSTVNTQPKALTSVL